MGKASDSRPTALQAAGACWGLWSCARPQPGDRASGQSVRAPRGAEGEARVPRAWLRRGGSCQRRVLGDGRWYRRGRCMLLFVSSSRQGKGHRWLTGRWGQHGDVHTGKNGRSAFTAKAHRPDSRAPPSCVETWRFRSTSRYKPRLPLLLLPVWEARRWFY